MKNIDYRFPGVDRTIRVSADSPRKARVEAAAQLTIEEVMAFKAALERMPPCDRQRWKQWLAF